jgi:hypothetical protein
MRTSMFPSSGFIGPAPDNDIYRYMVIDKQVEEVRTVNVHTFEIPLTDTIEIVHNTLSDWIKSDEGQWVIARAAQSPSWHRYEDPYQFHQKFIVRAKFAGATLTEWLLRSSR